MRIVIVLMIYSMLLDMRSLSYITVKDACFSVKHTSTSQLLHLCYVLLNICIIRCILHTMDEQYSELVIVLLNIILYFYNYLYNLIKCYILYKQNRCF